MVFVIDGKSDEITGDEARRFAVRVDDFDDFPQTRSNLCPSVERTLRKFDALFGRLSETLAESESGTLVVARSRHRKRRKTNRAGPYREQINVIDYREVTSTVTNYGDG